MHVSCARRVWRLAVLPQGPNDSGSGPQIQTTEPGELGWWAARGYQADAFRSSNASPACACVHCTQQRGPLPPDHPHEPLPTGWCGDAGSRVGTVRQDPRGERGWGRGSGRGTPVRGTAPTPPCMRSPAAARSAAWGPLSSAKDTTLPSRSTPLLSVCTSPNPEYCRRMDTGETALRRLG